MSESRREYAFLIGFIGFICLVYLGQVVLSDGVFLDLMVVPVDIAFAWEQAQQGEISLRSFLPLISYAFLHGSVEHLLFNMLYLWIFGAVIVQLLGTRWMLIVFAVTAICGGLFHTVKELDSWIPMLGASGAVMGFEGLYLGMAVQWRLPNPHVWPMSYPIPPMQLAAVGAIGAVMDYMGLVGGGLGVAYGAHIGGFVAGIVLGSLVVPMPRVAQHR